MGRKTRRRFQGDPSVMEPSHESENEIDVEHVTPGDHEEISEAKKLKMATSLDRDVDICAANGDTDVFGIRHDIRDTLNLMTARDSPLNHLVAGGGDDVIPRPASVTDDLAFSFPASFNKQLEQFNLTGSSSLMDTGLDFSVMDMPLFNEIDEVHMLSDERGDSPDEDELSLAPSLSPASDSLTPLSTVGSLTPLSTVGSLTPLTSVGSLTPLTSVGSLTPLTSVGSLTPLTSVGSLTPLTSAGSLTPVSPVTLSQSPVSLPMCSSAAPPAPRDDVTAGLPHTPVVPEAQLPDPKTGALIVPLQDAKGQLLGNIVLRQDLAVKSGSHDDGAPRQLELNDAYIIWNGAAAPGLLAAGQGLKVMPDAALPALTGMTLPAAHPGAEPKDCTTNGVSAPAADTGHCPLAQRSLSVPGDLQHQLTRDVITRDVITRDVTAGDGESPRQRETILQIEKRRSRQRKAHSVAGDVSTLGGRTGSLDGDPLTPDPVTPAAATTAPSGGGPPYTDKPNVGAVDRFIICSDTSMECVLCSFATDSYSAFKSHIICSHPCWRITKKLSKNRLLVEKSAKAVASLENSKKHIDSLNLHVTSQAPPARRKPPLGGALNGGDLEERPCSEGSRPRRGQGSKVKHKSKSKRVFKCEVCARMFVFEGSAANHVTEVHGRTEAHRAILVSNDFGQTFGPLHRCPHPPCVFTAFAKVDLDDHVTALHAQAPAQVFRCQVCGYSAESEVLLTKHRERIHGSLVT